MQLKKLKLLHNQEQSFLPLGGAILNIITNKMQNYLSATYTNSTSFTSYDDVRLRMNNSLLLSAKNKYFGWQLNLGQNYRKRRVVFSSKTGKWHEFHF
jgi:hypothetical protein